MKLALITDTHWGVRNDNSIFRENTKKFLNDIFFPEIDRLNIKRIVHLGDLLDRRKYVNINTARSLRKDFIEPILARDIKLDIILGNHDVHYKNTNEVNSVTELLGAYSVEIYHRAQEVTFDNLKVLIVPWICDDNRAHALEEIKKTDARICMGHLEIAGFEMYRGSVSLHGETKNLFDKFDSVFSGHYHHKSSDGHISYLGTHGQFTWSDYDDPRGFHIFDTETEELTFIANPYEIFKKIYYDDTNEVFKKFLHTQQIDIDFSTLTDCMIKVVVKNKTNPYIFDKFIEALEAVGPAHVQVVEDTLNLDLEDDEDIVSEAESTLEICTKYIDTLTLENINKKNLETNLIALYNEALALE